MCFRGEMQKEPERKKFEIYLYAPYNRPLEQTVIIFHSIITFPSLGGGKQWALARDSLPTFRDTFARASASVSISFRWWWSWESIKKFRFLQEKKNFFIFDAKGTHKLRNDRLTRSQRLGAALLKLKAPHMPIIVALSRHERVVKSQAELRFPADALDQIDISS